VPTAIPFEDPANYRRVHALIRRLWDDGAVQFSAHATKRMGRRGLDANDVQQIVRHGQIIEHNRPRPDKAWRHTLAGRTVDGAPAACVVAIEGRLIVITVRRREE
jgi:hypothetical protein